MNNFSLKKCEKSVMMSEKEKQRKGVFLVNDRECFFWKEKTKAKFDLFKKSWNE